MKNRIQTIKTKTKTFVNRLLKSVTLSLLDYATTPVQTNSTPISKNDKSSLEEALSSDSLSITPANRLELVLSILESVLLDHQDYLDIRSHSFIISLPRIQDYILSVKEENEFTKTLYLSYLNDIDLRTVEFEDPQHLDVILQSYPLSNTFLSACAISNIFEDLSTTHSYDMNRSTVLSLITNVFLSTLNCQKIDDLAFFKKDSSDTYYLYQALFNYFNSYSLAYSIIANNPVKAGELPSQQEKLFKGLD